MDGLFAPLKPVPPGLRPVLGILCFVLFFLGWGIVTYGGFVQPLFLASPGETLLKGGELFVEYGFAGDVLVTVWRVFAGFALAALLAVPLGILMGAFKPVEAFFSGFVSFARYLPASAFIPLLILWAGVGELQKILVIFIGSVFQIVIMIAVIVGSVRTDLVEAAYTLGASRRGVVLRVLLPAAAPQMAESLRLVLGWAWTYVIVAELVGASAGIGHMIIEAQRFLDTGQMIFGIFIIGMIGLITDVLFQAANARLFPWAKGR
ncbi:ABC transporter permease [Azospirillum halopraeferens]|uniref:ABC transporter permease n=1 Tax=Azospirillum halopraeferens TaxID=34010 RepID=UPI00042A871E|nr:ABC transporter permease [Azospirillum halopraeferens]